MQNVDTAVSLLSAQPRIMQGEPPVVSRVHAILDIVDFCEVAPQSSGLRCLLVRGKSTGKKESLIDEVSPILRKSHKVLLHLKFYPDSENEILPALTKSLLSYNHAHNLLKNELDGSLGAMLLAIRRLTRIRITVLIIEDMDALDSRARSELGNVLKALADARLSVILVSESLSLKNPEIFDPYLAGTVTLGGAPPKETEQPVMRKFPEELISGLHTIPEQPVQGIIFFGKIAVKGPGGIRKLQGQRTKKVLALLVAQALMDNPLSLSDFCRIATGEENDLDRARNMIYIAVHRLRQTCGEQIILKTSPVPQLNTDLVDIDILQANNNLESALSAIREGALLRAVTYLKAALEIWRGEILFPGLYDEFFESARDEFEFKLSSAIVKIAKSLIAEGDATQAHSVLEFAYPWLKEDQAIGDLYNMTLSDAGKFMSLRSLDGIER